MSRIGNAPITLPEGVEINISADNLVVVKGKLGELEQAVNPGIKVSVDEGIVTVSRSNDNKHMLDSYPTSATEVIHNSKDFHTSPVRIK